MPAGSRPPSAERTAGRSRARRPGQVSLARALSKLGFASRAQAVELVRAGRVRVGGRVERNPARAVVPERALLTVDRDPVVRAPSLTIAFHKPRGCVTTRSDEQGRPTIYDHLQDLPTRLVPVGRLDLASSGLLLLTNDTRLADWLADPANRLPRVYVVSVRGRLPEDAEQRLCAGIEDRGERLAASQAVVRKRSGRESHLLVTLEEGRNREVRRLCAAIGHEVTRLKRVAYGGIALGDLRPGAWRTIAAQELRRAFPGAPLDRVPARRQPAG